jgi:hypothetical protein
MNSNKIGWIFGCGFLAFWTIMSYAVCDVHKIAGIAFAGMGFFWASLIINEMFPDDFITQLLLALGTWLLLTALLGTFFQSNVIYIIPLIGIVAAGKKIYLDFRSQEDS